jgi:hypothetical protein
MSPQEKAQQRREQKAAYQKQYYEQHKERLLEARGKKYVCALCSGQYTKTHTTTHLKTAKHLKAVKLQAQLTNLSPELIAQLISRVIGQPESTLRDLILSIYKNEQAKGAPSPEAQQEAEDPEDQSKE